MERRTFLKGAGASAGSIAGLLALTGRPARVAAQELASATGAANKELIVLDPTSPQFRGLTQGFNRRWSAPNVSRIYVPLTEVGAQEALARVLADGWGENFRVRGGGHCYEDFVYNPAVRALIDMSLLNRIDYDERRGV